MTPASRWTLPVAVPILLLLLAWAYWPGLPGPFLFDDFSNLDVLGSQGHIHGWRDLLLYVTSGNADPTGRPVSLLSFLLDGRDWPTDPWPFKRTNLLLHLLNTLLLGVVIARLQSASVLTEDKVASRLTPLAAAALWAAHPFFVSTTLYVVQREAMLPMAFVLLGMLAWMRSVSAFASDRTRAGWAWAILGVGGATLLAGLSKANGFLAPALIGLAYLWFLRPQDPGQRRSTDRAAALCLGLPTLLLLAYLVYLGVALWHVSPLLGRDWTVPERMLSEPRALWSYLWRLAVPRAGGGGLFVEDFPVSHDWLRPWTTSLAWIALVTVSLAALVLRRRFPRLTFAWAFFITAHLMESTVIPLELYFEHRNYLAASMFAWPLAHALLRGGAYPRYRRASFGLLLASMLLLTRERATVWGNPELLGALSAAHETNSARAQVAAASQQIAHGSPSAGLARLRALQRDEPESVDAAITAISAECAVTGKLAMDTLARTKQTLATSRIWNYGLYDWLQAASVDPALRACRGFGLEGLSGLIDSAQENPQNQLVQRRRDLLHARGSIALAAGDSRGALRWYDAAVALLPEPDYALVQAAALGNASAPALGVEHLDHYMQLKAAQRVEPLGSMPGIHAWLLNHFSYYQKEITSLRAQLQADAARPPPKPAPSTSGGAT